MRELQKDLETCIKATPGPWGGVKDQVAVSGSRGRGTAITIGENKNNNADFIIEAREGWPEAIQRAMKVEEENAELKQELIAERSWLVDVLKALELACKYTKETQHLTTACPDDFNFECVKASGGKCSWKCWENFFLAKARCESRPS